MDIIVICLIYFQRHQVAYQKTETHLYQNKMNQVGIVIFTSFYNIFTTDHYILLLLICLSFLYMYND